MKRITALIIMDGFGVSDDTRYNAIAKQGVPAIRRLCEQYPHTLIGASGEDVGLPDGQMGNSEVGHLNIGAGRIVYQELTRITSAVRTGEFYKNQELTGAVDGCIASGGALHVMGLCSDGGVHSSLEHLFAIIKLAKQRGLERVYVHCFMDGRDTAPDSGAGFIERIENELANIGCGKIATISGRYYAMDRDKHYDRVERAYAAMVYGEGERCANAEEAVRRSYADGITDEFIVPTVITSGGEPTATVRAGDAIIFFNFRPDRARQITRAFIMDDFDGFDRRYGKIPVKFVSMTQYDADFEGRLGVAFKPQSLNNTFGEYIADLGLKQLRIAETEKYAHVTFFFNGGVEEPNRGEDRVLIPSPKVATFDLKPEMSAREVTDEAIRRIKSGEYDVMILNYANPDMVGHTGKLDAAVKAVATVDECVDRLVKCILDCGGRCILTADHGNCEKMAYDDGEPFTAHTTLPVPFIYIDDENRTVSLREGGRLCDITPTMLDMMGIEKPKEMTGETLIVR